MSERRRSTRRAAPGTPHLVEAHLPPARGDDEELDAVTDELLRIDPSGRGIGEVLRETFDQLYDGQRTGRWSPDELSKTEKTHMGTLVEINLQRRFEFADGDRMDFSIAGIDVDCKFSARLGGWMLPREAYLNQHLCLVLWASEALSRWMAGVVRAVPRSEGLPVDEIDDLLGSENQDRKRTLTAAGESRVRWLYESPRLPRNLLFHLDKPTRDQILGLNLQPGDRRPSGQAKVNSLFRLVQRELVDRGSLLTVAQQDDSPKRARDARLWKHLGKEGILVFGHQEADPIVAQALGLPVPQKGSFVSARVVPAEETFDGPTALIEGHRWRLAEAGDPVVVAPQMLRVRREA